MLLVFRISAPDGIPPRIVEETVETITTDVVLEDQN